MQQDRFTRTMLSIAILRTDAIYVQYLVHVLHRIKQNKKKTDTNEITRNQISPSSPVPRSSTFRGVKFFVFDGFYGQEGFKVRIYALQSAERVTEASTKVSSAATCLCRTFRISGVHACLNPSRQTGLPTCSLKTTSLQLKKTIAIGVFSS